MSAYGVFLAVWFDSIHFQLYSPLDPIYMRSFHGVCVAGQLSSLQKQKPLHEHKLKLGYILHTLQFYGPQTRMNVRDVYQSQSFYGYAAYLVVCSFTMVFSPAGCSVTLSTTHPELQSAYEPAYIARG